MASPLALIFDLIAKDSASPAFLRVASAADKAAAATGRATTSVERSAVRMQTVGSRLTKAMTVPLLGIGAVSVEQAAKFQKSMTLIQTAGGETAAKAAVISKGIKKVAVDTGTSLTALSDGIYTVAKAGAGQWSAVDQLKVLKAAAQGAKAENVDLATATTALTSVMASYGLKASDAVQAENMLIRGSGLAKTTFQDFSASLANVVPLASSLHISFAEIAGAVATMTQHGETAQRSTENLSNLITALAGQNNVASAAMQQLGINTIDLQKNLGKRGLSGTLDIVEAALAKNSKGGMVTVSAFKEAQKATASLATMVGTFSGTLKKQSEGLESGKVGIKDYQQYAKSLGGQAGASALQFLALYKATFGFNNALKSGNGDVATSASVLQKMLGGVTGMRVALMLGGTSAKQFATNVKDVAAAARQGGVDVLGWAKTSDTLSVKMDKAKANLQVMAVEIGTALIPAVTKIAAALSSAVTWFQNLSGTQKQIAAWAAGILLAMGPLFSIGGKLIALGSGIGRFAVGLGNVFARMATDATGMSAGVTRAMTGMTSALAGAGIGVAIGSLTRNSSTGAKAIGALASAGAGAAIGFGVGGPLGAAIGGIAGGLTSLATAFLGAGSGARQMIKPTQELTDAIRSDNDALGHNTELLIANALESKGMYDVASKLGISQKLLTDATTGNSSAMQTVTGVIKSATVTYDGYLAALEKQNSTATRHISQLNLQKEAYGKLTPVQRQAYDAAVKLNAGVGDMTKTLAVNERAAINVDMALGKLANPHNLNVNNKEAVAAIRYAQLQINGLRQKVTPTLNLNTFNAEQKIARLQSMIDSLNGNLSGMSAGTLGSISGLLPGKASGGTLPRGFASVGEQGPELAYTGGGRTRIFSNSVSRRILAATGMRAPGFAGGTSNEEQIYGFLKSLGMSNAVIAGIMGNFQVESGFRASARNSKEGAVGIAQWEGARRTALEAFARTQGTTSTTLSTQLKFFAKELATKFPGLLGKLGGKSAGEVAALFDSGYERSSGSTRGARIAAAKDLLSQMVSGTLKPTLSGLQKALDSKLQTAIQSASDALTKFKDQVTTVAQAIMGGFNITTAGTIDTSSGTPSLALQQAQARYAKGQALPGDEALLGGDGSGGGVSVSQILGSLTQTISDAVKFRAELAKLRKEGLNPLLEQQLAEGGVATSGATVDALATQATAAQIRQLSKGYDQLQKIATGTGTDVANSLEGRALKAAQDQVKLLQELSSGVKHVGSDVAAALNSTASAAHAKARGNR